MPDYGYRAQEIIVAAISVLMLVLLLGFLITYNADVGADSMGRSRRGTARWRSNRQEAAQVISSLQRESFLESARHRSATLAEDLKRELTSLKRRLSASPLLEPEPRPSDPRVTSALATFAMEPLGAAPGPGEQGRGQAPPGVRDSFALATGRDSLLIVDGPMARRPSNQATADGDDGNVAAQGSSTSSSPPSSYSEPV